MRRKIEHSPNALITGGSSGIGLEIARLLAGAGCNVLIVSNDSEKLLKAQQELLRAGGQVQALEMDLAYEDSADRLYAYCKEMGFEVDILVNNAGMFFYEPLTPDRLEEAKRMLILHNYTPLRLCTLFAEDMKRRGCGYILNVASIAAHLPVPGLDCYAASKAFLKTFSKALHNELKGSGVKLCAVCPAAVSTTLYGLNEKLLKFGTDIHFIQKPSKTAKRALRSMWRGRKICYPAFMCYYLPVLLKLAPDALIRYIWKKTKGKKEYVQS